MAKLVVITKGLPPSSHELDGNWTTIGRAEGNTFQIVEPSVSGRHCEMRLRENELVVRDLLSTNGTFVEGKKITEAVLKPGQTLRLGEVELRFEVSAAAPSAPFVTKMLVTGASPKPVAPAPPAPKPPGAPDARQPEASGAPAKKYHVLFVDDSMALLETFSELCSLLSNRTWEVYCATTADRALAVLQETPMDLVVLDIGMPLVDGIQLLNLINRRFPAVKTAVMTGHATESNRAACLANGAELFIEKPIANDGNEAVFNLLNDLLSYADREGFSGALRRVGLPEVVQMECVGRRSSILEIRNPQWRGRIYIEAGAITHAAVGTLVGEQAVYRLLSLKSGEFRLQPFEAPPQRTVNSSWEFLLMEAARACDEETVFIAKPAAPDRARAAGAPGGKLAPQVPPPAAEGDHAATAGDIVVAATYDGRWKPVDGSKK